jgi:hypothetical protein
MSISERLSDDFKEALKKGDKRKVSILRVIRAAIKNKEIEKGDSLKDEEIFVVLRSFVKRAKESIEQFSKGEREDLVKKEEEELEIIQSYLPKELTEDEIRRLVKDTIDEVGAKGPKDIGKVMKTIMSKVKGQVDGKFVNELVRKALEV